MPTTFYSNLNVYVLKPNGKKADTVNPRGSEIVINFQGIFPGNYITFNTTNCQLEGKKFFLNGDINDEGEPQDASGVTLSVLPDNGVDTITIDVELDPTHIYNLSFRVELCPTIYSLTSSTPFKPGTSHRLEIRGTHLTEDMVWTIRDNPAYVVIKKYIWINEKKAYIHIEISNETPRTLAQILFTVWRDNVVLLEEFADNRTLAIEIARVPEKFPFAFIFSLAGITAFIMLLFILSGGK